MGLVQDLVDQGIWLEEGKVEFYGQIRQAVMKYLEKQSDFNEQILS